MNHSVKTFLTAGMLAALPFAVSAPAHAAALAPSGPVAPVIIEAPVTFKQPDLISLGFGEMDFDKQEPLKRSGDFRGEYRWGVSLLPLISSWFRPWDNYVQFHPFAGAETTTRGALWTGGGFATDFYAGRHVVITWSEGVGFYEPGNMASLHGNAEFRSQFEAGWRFNNEMRLTAEISHISDAGLTKSNPGAEIAGVYLHIPVDLLVRPVSY